ncbi:Uncharacterized protein TCM_005160 isoform 1 [Theobroma cacao]|uniref:Uncharacterized protein isoform 1 n=1 Tax=Theobroma cacao TaxID=3641 RepID=A0A061DTN3_THECC|nr:Uncharacterized protein TCM_005160 isoform 1 [Theobroma cacao]EOX95726.1 Uncharacterized protein TCM_005160 isoform 1 [Theobroma cacao]EOX95727.1 Uncharacterized protein TCM_005160 isoform 1 [Theobroma cacao]
MAFRGSISSRATLLSRRLNPSFSHILHTNNDNNSKSHPLNLSQSLSAIRKILFQGSSNAINGLGCSLSQDRTSSLFPQPIGDGLPSCRFMSSTTGEGSERIDDVGYVAEAVRGRTVDALTSQAPGMSMVAVAAADYSYPVVALRHLMDTVHS